MKQLDKEEISANS